jgi:hypothetical protein
MITYRTPDQLPRGWDMQLFETGGPTWIYWFDTLTHAIESLLDHQDIQILELRNLGRRDIEIRFRAETGDGRAVFTQRT